MNSFACVLLIVAAVVAEPPQYRQARFQPEKQVGEAEAPYPAAGYRPAKEFKLPSREEFAPPSTSYGVSDNSYQAPKSYAAPQSEYGVPRNAEEGKENRETESIGEETKEKGKLEEAKEVVSAEGAYYVLLPGSQLQRVQFQTENDLRNMAYTARLQYKKEDRAPIFVYSAVPQYQPNAAYVQIV